MPRCELMVYLKKGPRCRGRKVACLTLRVTCRCHDSDCHDTISVRTLRHFPSSFIVRSQGLYCTSVPSKISLSQHLILCITVGYTLNHQPNFSHYPHQSDIELHSTDENQLHKGQSYAISEGLKNRSISQTSHLSP